MPPVVGTGSTLHIVYSVLHIICGMKDFMAQQARKKST